MRNPNGKIIARSVGYRVGKQAVRSRREYSPDFSQIFVPELVPEAERGYDEGMKFVREQDEKLRARYAALSKEHNI